MLKLVRLDQVLSIFEVEDIALASFTG
jgi:hypothetical protein